MADKREKQERERLGTAEKNTPVLEGEMKSNGGASRMADRAGLQSRVFLADVPNPAHGR
jgi:hypothetical protein